MSAQAKPQVRTSAGLVSLGQQLGSGFEGAVYNIAGCQATVAKIYHKPVACEKAEKLAAMAAMRDDRLRAVTAWPTELLITSAGAACGFLMPKLSGYKDIHYLYGPRSRRTEFSKAGFRFVIRAAANTARAFAAVHGSGCVIGDVNHGGIAVSPGATVKLLDCDSFQALAGGRTFPCDVGTPLYTPPEMQGRSFRGMVRQPNQDGFGLAVILFHLLFAGRHPFAGRFLGYGDMTIEQAITEFRFAYGHKRSSAQMKPPPGTPPLEIASPQVALLFERAFSREGAKGLRPGADEWVAALEALERQTRQCTANASHHYYCGLQCCPWCKVEVETGVTLYGVAIQSPASKGAGFDIHAAWVAVTAVPVPEPAQSPADLSRVGAVSPSREAQAAGGSASVRALGVAAVVVAALAFMAVIPAAFVLWLVFGGGVAVVIMNKRPAASVMQRFRSSRNAAKGQLDALEARWRSEANGERFSTRMRQLEDAKRIWGDMPNERYRRLRLLDQQREGLQRQRFLERFQLGSVTIPGIGPGRKAMLASYNVETAADFEESKLRQIPGFGPAMISKLRRWRASLEVDFRFDSTKGIDPQDITGLDRELAGKKVDLERDILNGPADLRRLSQEILLARSTLAPQIADALRMVAQAEVDLRAIRG